jgi:predicted small lipoprotein YifL
MRPHPIPEKILKRIQAVTVVSVLVLQGCGHKGPLMLPAPPVQASPAPASAVQTTSPQNPEMPSSQPYQQP